MDLSFFVGAMSFSEVEGSERGIFALVFQLLSFDLKKSDSSETRLGMGIAANYHLYLLN